MTVEFFLPCVPPTTSHHHKRIVKMGRFARLADRPELQAAKHTLDALLQPFRPPAPLTGPLSLSLRYEWPWRASETKAARAAGRQPRTTKPDLDNLAKTITDRLVCQRFIADDQLIVRLVLEKWWGDTPGIHVHIHPFVSGQEADRP
jgi:Holliday junction resolvase RusA-like endonuclease